MNFDTTIYSTKLYCYQNNVDGDCFYFLSSYRILKLLAFIGTLLEAGHSVSCDSLQMLKKNFLITYVSK